MDLENPRSSPPNSNPAVLHSGTDDDQREVAWAAFGLVLWSGVVLIGLFGAVYILGHSILHLW